MPRSILPASIRRAFSAFPKDIDDFALARYFTLTAADHRLLARSRGDHNRLGLACQIGWLRWLGWQPDSAKGAPPAAPAFLARQLNLSPEILADYPDHPRTWWLHAEQVRQHLGWREYRQAEATTLAAALFKEALQYDNARGLFEAAVSDLRREQIVRPALTALERAVASARARAEAHLAKVIDDLLTAEQKKELNALIAPPASGAMTPLAVSQGPARRDQPPEPAHPAG
jgi:hypothetical protein